MSSTTPTTPGGFIGDPAEAFTPPAVGGCCGSASVPGREAEADAAGQCCGTVIEVAVSGGCCGGTTKAQAVASGAGCCR